MGRADSRGKMELRAPEDAPETCWACRDARRDDPHPSSCTCCLSGRQENKLHLIGILATIHLGPSQIVLVQWKKRRPSSYHFCTLVRRSCIYGHLKSNQVPNYKPRTKEGKREGKEREKEREKRRGIKKEREKRGEKNERKKKTQF